MWYNHSSMSVNYLLTTSRPNCHPNNPPLDHLQICYVTPTHYSNSQFHFKFRGSASVRPNFFKCPDSDGGGGALKFRYAFWAHFTSTFSSVDLAIRAPTSDSLETDPKHWLALIPHQFAHLPISARSRFHPSGPRIRFFSPDLSVAKVSWNVCAPNKF